MCLLYFFGSILVRMAYMQCVGWTWFADCRSFAALNASANRNRSATDFNLIGGPRNAVDQMWDASLIRYPRFKSSNDEPRGNPVVVNTWHSPISVKIPDSLRSSELAMTCYDHIILVNLCEWYGYTRFAVCGGTDRSVFYYCFAWDGVSRSGHVIARKGARSLSILVYATPRPFLGL